MKLNLINKLVEGITSMIILMRKYLKIKFKNQLKTLLKSTMILRTLKNKVITMIRRRLLIRMTLKNKVITMIKIKAKTRMISKIRMRAKIKTRIKTMMMKTTNKKMILKSSKILNRQILLLLKLNNPIKLTNPQRK